MQFRRLFLILLFIVCSVFPAYSQNIYEYGPGFVPETRGGRLLKEFVDRLQPRKMKMILDEEPEDSGRIRTVYMEIADPVIGNIQIEDLTLDAYDVEFNPPSSWSEDGIEARNILLVHAKTCIREDDINETLARKAFGHDEHWHGLRIDFKPEGIYARGYYLAKVLMVKLDILIEISGQLKVVDRQQIWLDKYALKVNKVSVPDSVTERAMGKIQPIIDLSKFMFPLELDTVRQDEERVYIRSHILPEPFDGITYRYSVTAE